MLFTVEPRDEGRLLRAFLRERGISAALLAKLKQRAGGICQNGTPVTVRAVLHAGDRIELAVEDAAPPLHVVPRDLPVQILCKTPDFAVLNKQAGMPTHPSHGHFEDTLANALVFHFSTPGAPFCPRFVNRLDRNTTGAVLVAMHALAASALSRSMAAGEIQKEYLALVHGCVRERVRIETGIRRRTESIIYREVCPTHEGDLALTQVEPLFATEQMTLVRLVPETGRTHQLRVHMAHLGHPLLGDDLYGIQDGFGRHALHAATLTFPCPATGERVTVHAPLPCDMRAMIEGFGKEATELALAQTSPQKCE